MKKTFFIFAFLILITILGYIGYIVYLKGNISTIDKEMPWQVYTYKNYRFAIESPMPLLTNKKTFVDINKESKKLSLFADSMDQSFHLVLESQEYRGSIPQDHLEQFQKKIVEMFHANENIQSLHCDSDPITFSGSPGIEISGDYINSGQSYRFDVVEIAQGEWSWDLETAYLDNSALNDEAKRIFQSFKIQD